MKTKTLLLTIFCALALNIQAGITTYTFKSVTWTSDPAGGWVCDKEASAYDAGRIYADGTLHSAGVSVKTSSSGAGATSVLSFTDIRRIIVNFCQNASDGRGVIYMQVGENEPDSIIVTKPVESGTGNANRDSIFLFSTPKTGKIKFWVTCTHNAININSISIRSASGESPVFTQDTYQLVTNINQLEDSDQIIIGVHKNGVSKIMGYFDEYISQNNIHAINDNILLTELLLLRTTKPFTPCEKSCSMSILVLSYKTNCATNSLSSSQVVDKPKTDLLFGLT